MGNLASEEQEESWAVTWVLHTQKTELTDSDFTHRRHKTTDFTEIPLDYFFVFFLIHLILQPRLKGDPGPEGDPGLTVRVFNHKNWPQSVMFKMKRVIWLCDFLFIFCPWRNVMSWTTSGRLAVAAVSFMRNDVCGLWFKHIHSAEPSVHSAPVCVCRLRETLRSLGHCVRDWQFRVCGIDQFHPGEELCH